MAHPDEAVKPANEEPSELIAEARLRHEIAGTDEATPQEKRQAEVEQAHALSTRPDGSYAQLHETEEPTLAVADQGEVQALKKNHEEALAALKGDADASATRETAPATERRPASKAGTETAAAQK